MIGISKNKQNVDINKFDIDSSKVGQVEEELSGSMMNIALFGIIYSSIIIAMNQNGFADVLGIRRFSEFVLVSCVIASILSCYGIQYYHHSKHGNLFVLSMYLLILLCMSISFSFLYVIFNYFINIKNVNMMVSPPRNENEESIQTYMLSLYDSCCIESDQFPIICKVENITNATILPCTENEILFETFKEITGNRHSRVCNWLDTVKVDIKGEYVKTDRICSDGPRRWTIRALKFFKSLILGYSIFTFYIIGGMSLSLFQIFEIISRKDITDDTEDAVVHDEVEDNEIEV